MLIFFLLHLSWWKSNFLPSPFLFSSIDAHTHFFFLPSQHNKKGLFNNSTHILSKCLFSLHSKQHKPHIIYPNNKTLTMVERSMDGSSLARLPLLHFCHIEHYHMVQKKKIECAACIKRELAHQQYYRILWQSQFKNTVCAP